VDYSAKVLLFALSGLKVKVIRLRVNFVQVCEWFDGCDRLKIIFKSKKNKITICEWFYGCDRLKVIFKWINESNIF